MSRGVFVTGTDTGVGKTLAACLLIRQLRARAIDVAPMKPIAAGASDFRGRQSNDDSRALLAAAGRDDIAMGDVTPILLREPMAPHIAAAREGCRIDLAPVEAALARLRSRADFLVVEGVGGFVVPLGPALDTVDLARAVGLPVVLVVGLRLGCLNHALLSARAIEGSGLGFAGWIANSIDPAMAAREANIEALEERLSAPRLGTLPHTDAADFDALARLLDVAPLL